MDELIAMTHGSDIEALRWVVFGSDAAELSHLDGRWSSHIQLTLVLMPATVSDVSDAVLTVLEAEGISALECACIKGAGTALKNLAEFGVVIDALGRDACSVMSEMRRWASMRTNSRRPGGPP